MSRGYGQNKRQREDERARKQRDKAMRRMEKREMGPREIPVEHSGIGQSESPSIEELMKSLERGAGQDRSASSVPARLFVGGLSDEVTEDDLLQAFGAFGPVADVIVMRDRDSRQPRGFGFVTMADRKDAPRVINELHGSELRGKSIVVNVATERR